MVQILIAEDDKQSCYYLKSLLEAEGYDVVAVGNGREAMDSVLQRKPDMIIADIMMPVMNGFRLCQEIKQDDRFRDIPFIFYTATFVEKEDEELAMGLGASRFIVKPVEIDPFLEIINDVLGDFQSGRLSVPGRLMEDKQKLLQLYDQSMSRKLEEKVEKLRQEKIALKISEKRLHEAQEITHIGHWDMDLRDGVLRWSDEMYRILGLKPGEFAPSYEAFLEAVVPEDRERVAEAYQASLSKKTEYDIQHRLRSKEGEIKYVCAKCQTQYNNSGSPLYLIGTLQDITQQKQMEMDREAAIRGLSLANTRLENIIYATCHDLRSPLVNVQGFTSELAHDCAQLDACLNNLDIAGEVREQYAHVQRDIQDVMEVISSNVVKMDHLLTGLYNYCSVGQERPDIQSLDMNVLVKDVLKCMQYQIDKSGATVTLASLPPCLGDVAMSSRVFNNLILNAIQYLDPLRPGRVHISGRVEGKVSVYCVEDNGVGIEREHQKKIFDVFHRLEPRGAVPGEGLGLSIALHALGMQNGTICLESERGKGSHFYVALPAVAELSVLMKDHSCHRSSP